MEEVEEARTSSPDIASRRMLILATLILWSANFLIFTMISALNQPERWLGAIAPRLLLTAIGVGFCFLLHLLLQWTGRKGFRRQLVVAAVITPLAADAYGWCNYAVATAIYGDFPELSLGETIFQLSLHFWFFASWIGFYLAISYSLRLRHQEKREAMTRFLAQAAQLQALHYQISPHFLFNTLNSISSLIVDGRNDDAEAMVQCLAEFLRLTLELDPKEDVTLEAELLLQCAYLEVERVRFPDLMLIIEIDEDVRSASIPSLILQPLVENAVKHGVARNLGPSRIEILAVRSERQIEVQISNQASSARPEDRAGIGLRNVRDRLAARFGDLASLSAGFSQPGHYQVRLVMPLVARA